MASSDRPSPRGLPSVDRIVRDLGDLGLPRPVVVALVRGTLQAIRDGGAAMGEQAVLARVRSAIDDLLAMRLRPIVNGTGIVLHTNFGRAVLGPTQVRAVVEAAGQYTNLEYDLTAGRRGGRAAYLEHNLALLCDAPAATVVNNCAAALVLALRHYCNQSERNEVIVSRGELVQIGGGFRVPEILQVSGATLREVGTTNRTAMADYAAAITPRTALLLKVHQSNFYMGGFTAAPAREELAGLARENRLPFVEDLGSGAFFDTDELPRQQARPPGDGDSPSAKNAAPEPTPRNVIAGGATLVTFSGDKLLGGSQAGVIAGDAAAVAALKTDPFFRALRCDKLAMAALQATVDAHLTGDATQTLPALAMMHATPESLRPRAAAIAARLQGVDASILVGRGDGAVGGGSLPRAALPSATVDIRPVKQLVETLASQLRRRPLPIVGYIADGTFKLDVRTIFPEQDAAVVAALRDVLSP